MFFNVRTVLPKNGKQKKTLTNHPLPSQVKKKQKKKRNKQNVKKQKNLFSSFFASESEASNNACTCPEKTVVGGEWRLFSGVGTEDDEGGGEKDTFWLGSDGFLQLPLWDLFLLLGWKKRKEIQDII